MSSRKVLCVDDDVQFAIGLKLALRGRYCIYVESSLEAAIEAIKKEHYDLVLLDVNLNGTSGVDGIQKIHSTCSGLDIVMLSGRRDPKTVVSSMKSGAIDYLTKPVDIEELCTVIDKAVGNRDVKDKYETLLANQNAEDVKGNIVFKSESMKKVLVEADQLKGHQANVLIAGETGTGKELLARYIHRQEGQASRPFVAVNCAAIPEQLLEAELFGSEPGAYTGALKRRIGKFEIADGGDIFLDEIGSLRPDIQAKILRVLQEKEFCRLGGNEMIKTNFRVIAATNELLENRVRAASFRIDLYHRIRVIELHLPPLRERVVDIPVLVEYYLAKYSRNGSSKKISNEALSRLMAYNWPGNVRELANVVHSLSILATGEEIDESVFPSWALNGCTLTGSKDVDLPVVETGITPLESYMNRAERHYIDHALRYYKGDKSKTARALGLGRTTLYTKLRSLGMILSD